MLSLCPLSAIQAAAALGERGRTPNDDRVLFCCLARRERMGAADAVTLVSRDGNLRLKASSCGVAALEPRSLPASRAALLRMCRNGGMPMAAVQDASRGAPARQEPSTGQAAGAPADEPVHVMAGAAHGSEGATAQGCPVLAPSLGPALQAAGGGESGTVLAQTQPHGQPSPALPSLAGPEAAPADTALRGNGLPAHGESARLQGWHSMQDLQSQQSAEVRSSHPPMLSRMGHLTLGAPHASRAGGLLPDYEHMLRGGGPSDASAGSNGFVGMPTSGLACSTSAQDHAFAHSCGGGGTGRGGPFRSMGSGDSGAFARSGSGHTERGGESWANLAQEALSVLEAGLSDTALFFFQKEHGNVWTGVRWPLRAVCASTAMATTREVAGLEALLVRGVDTARR